MEHAKFLVNGKETGTPASMGGLEEMDGEETLSLDESDTYGWSTHVKSLLEPPHTRVPVFRSPFLLKALLAENGR